MGGECMVGEVVDGGRVWVVAVEHSAAAHEHEYRSGLALANSLQTGRWLWQLVRQPGL